MPSTKNPGAVIVGAGTVPSNTVEDASLKTPLRDAAILRSHLEDPSRAHAASSISIVDAGGYFTGDQVEEAIQELAGGASSGRQNGMVSGGTVTALGLVITLDLTVIQWDAVLQDRSGESVTIAGADGTYYVYFQGSDGVLTFSGTLPALVNEPILVAVVTKVGVAITSITDARFFVPNLDRKIDYTVRADAVAAGDNTAEACFLTLEAAFFWVNNYAPLQDTKRSIIIRGAHTLSSVITIAADGLEIRGEGDATITWDGTSLYMFSVTAQERLVFRDLTFVCASANLTPYCLYSAGNNTDFLIERCSFVNGATDWKYPIILGAFGVSLRATVRDCDVELALNDGAGITMDNPTECTVENCTVTGPGATVTSSTGVYFNTGGSKNRIHGVRVSNTYYGMVVRTEIAISDCHVSQVTYGIRVRSGAVDTRITGSYFETDPTNGLYGALVEATGVSILGCSFVATRDVTTYGVSTPYGISLSGAHRTRIEGCHISGFAKELSSSVYGLSVASCAGIVATGNTLTNCSSHVNNSIDVIVSDNHFSNDLAVIVSAPVMGVAGSLGVVLSENVIDYSSTGVSLGFQGGINVTGTAANPAANISVTGNVVQIPYGVSPYNGITFYGNVTQSSILGNTVDGYVSGDPFDPVTYSGIYVASNATDTATEITVSNNTVTRCRNGIVFDGGSSGILSGLTITGNTVSYCAYAVAISGVGTTGISLQFCREVVVSGNVLDHLGETIDSTGAFGFPSGAAVSSLGIYLDNCQGVSVNGNRMSNSCSYNGGEIRGIFCQMQQVGAETTYRDISICNNHLTFLSTGRGTDQGGVGIVVSAFNLVAQVQTVDGVRIESNTLICDYALPISRGIDVCAGYRRSSAVESSRGFGVINHVRVCNNVIDGFALTGVTNRISGVVSDMAEVVIQGNQVLNGLPVISGIATGGSSDKINLEAGSSAINDYYVGWRILINTGSAIGDIRTILDYTGSTRSATVSDWSAATGVGDEYELLPPETVAGVSSSWSPGTLTQTADGGGAATLTLASATSSTVNDYYAGWTITMTSGLADGDTRTVTTYVGGTFVATVSVAWSALPANGDSYTLERNGTMVGIDVSGNTINNVCSNGIRIHNQSDSNEVLSRVKVSNNVISDVQSTFAITSGTCTGSTPAKITLADGSSSVDDHYNGLVVYMTSGVSIGQARVITSYENSTLEATISPNWTVQPVSGNDYEIIGKFTASGSATAGGASTITLDAGVDLDRWYEGFLIYVETGAAAKDLRFITGYNSTTKVATVNRAWTGSPGLGDTYYLIDPYTACGIRMVSDGTLAPGLGLSQITDNLIGTAASFDTAKNVTKTGIEISSTGTLIGFDVDRNTIYATDAGILESAESTVAMVSTSSNKVYLPDERGDTDGITCDFASAIIQLKVDENQVVNAMSVTRSGRGVDVKIGTDADQLSVSRNQVLNGSVAAQNGIAIHRGFDVAGQTWNNLTVNGNFVSLKPLSWVVTDEPPAASVFVGDFDGAANPIVIKRLLVTENQIKTTNGVGNSVGLSLNNATVSSSSWNVSNNISEGGANSARLEGSTPVFSICAQNIGTTGNDFNTVLTWGALAVHTNNLSS